MATKTFEELKQLAIQIRDEKTNKQNTATRVGTAMLEHINKLEQDYYDKTQTDEELKERDDKLTELDSKLKSNEAEINNKLKYVPSLESESSDDSDLEISDERGNTIAKFANGHIKTKEFDSENPELKNELSSNDSDLDITDEKGNIVARFSEGHIKTKEFDSRFPERATNKLLFSFRNRTVDDFNDNSWTDNKLSLTNAGALGEENKLILEREYAIKDSRYIVDFSVENEAVVYIGSVNGVDALNESTQFSIDFTNQNINVFSKYNGTIKKTISIQNVSDYANKTFRFIIKRNVGWYLTITLINLTDNTLIYHGNLEQGFGLMRDKIFCYSTGAAMSVKDLYIDVPVGSNGECLLIILGDSITEGYLSGDDYGTYSVRIMNMFPSGTAKVSGRNGGTINGVLKRLESEVKLLKPKYVMVGIGTNNGNTEENLTQLINRIYELGAIPIINRIPCMSNSIQSANNNLIESVVNDFRNNGKEIYSCMMNVATAINRNLDDGFDASKFNPDYVHPNSKGHLDMFLQSMIDIPFMFN